MNNKRRFENKVIHRNYSTLPHPLSGQSFIYLFFHNMMTSSKRSIKTFSYDYYHQTRWRCLLSLKNKKISRGKNCKINLIIKQSYFLWKLISKKQNKSQDNFNEFFWIIRILWPKTLQIWIKRVQFWNVKIVRRIVNMIY